MLLKAEFEANKSFIEHSQEDMLEAGEKLMSCQKLQDLFYMVLMAGNFLNSVSHHLFRIIAKSQNHSRCGGRWPQKSQLFTLRL